MTETVLKAQSISKVYEQGQLRVPVLKDINLEVAQGEQLAIVGSSGTGKSTLLHLLGGLNEPTRGCVFLDGENLSELDEVRRGHLRNRKLGFVYQFHHLLAEFTSLENVMMPLLVRRLSDDESRQRALEILDQVGLAHRLEHKPSELSGGERQRVAIARALVTKPVCVLADEPTGNVDQLNARNIQSLMMDLDRDYKVSLVVATHDLQIADSTDRVLHLEDGTLK